MTTPKFSTAGMLKPEWPGRDSFRSQVLRLAAITFFGTLPDEGITELIDSLIRITAGDQEKARRVIDQCLKSPTLPTPADFEAIASELGSENVPRGCELCEGTGMRYVSKRFNRTALDENSQPYVYETYEADCQERCDCELGRHLKAREKEVEAAEHSR